MDRALAEGRTRRTCRRCHRELNFTVMGKGRLSQDSMQPYGKLSTHQVLLANVNGVKQHCKKKKKRTGQNSSTMMSEIVKVIQKLVTSRYSC